jgi:hypothetical protein
MDDLNLETLERIPIPEGLEERLSAKIDEWEQEERITGTVLRDPISKGNGIIRTVPVILRYTAVAASIALVFGVGYHLLSQDKYMNLAEQDTYQDPLLAKQEAERALTLLAVNLNKGMGHLEKAKALSDETEERLNEQLNLLK